MLLVAPASAAGVLQILFCMRLCSYELSQLSECLMVQSNWSAGLQQLLGANCDGASECCLLLHACY